ncbi:MAG: beta-lactamase family protein, partial [Anaerolineae bacterium]|nr:beta-lactamase family protein [Anaerolineae bacterium]
MKKLLVLLLALTLVIPVSAQNEETYTDPAGLFSVPIPTNWTAEQADGYAILASPDDLIQVYLLTAEGSSTVEAIEAAWKQVIPDFALEAIDTQTYTEPSITAGAEEVSIITYDNPEDEQTIFQGVGMLYEGRVYLMLFKADLTAAQQRAAQLNIINTGYEITALEQTDLTGVEPLPITDDLIAELETYILEKMEQLEVVGASVAIVQGDEVVYAKGFGVRGGDFTDPVTPDTHMMIGSTTKTMTTMLMGILVDEGKMRWDQPVVEILPNFTLADPEVSQQITVQNMVCACTGVPRRDFELIFNGGDLTAEGIIESLATFELFTDFGEAFQYSNQMVAAGGYVTAAAAGGEYGSLQDAYYALMQERIFDPIGMTSTTFSFEEVTANNNYAIPHMLNSVYEYNDVPLSTETWLASIAPAGSVWSTANDMAQYLITEINRGAAPDGTQIISEENLTYTWQPQVPISANMSYGLGWIIENYKGLPIYSHGGNTLGFTSEMAFLPDAELGIVVLANQQASMFNQAVSYRLLEMVFEQEFEQEGQINFALQQISDSVEEFQAQIQDSIEPEALQALAGTYTNEALGTMSLEVSENQLYGDAGEFRGEIRAAINEDGELYYFF